MKTQIKKMASKTMMIATALLLSTVLLVSCSNSKIGNEKSTVNVPESGNDSVYTLGDKMPKFDGDLSAFLSNTIRYPDSARTNNITGTVYVNFIVRNDGAVTDAKVIRSSDNRELDAEAMRAVNAMPKWIPGEKDGKKVNVSFNLPIKFALK